MFLYFKKHKTCFFHLWFQLSPPGGIVIRRVCWFVQWFLRDPRCVFSKSKSPIFVKFCTDVQDSIPWTFKQIKVKDQVRNRRSENLPIVMHISAVVWDKLDNPTEVYFGMKADKTEVNSLDFVIGRFCLKPFSRATNKSAEVCILTAISTLGTSSILA